MLFCPIADDHSSRLAMYSPCLSLTRTVDAFISRISFHLYSGVSSSVNKIMHNSCSSPHSRIMNKTRFSFTPLFRRVGSKLWICVAGQTWSLLIPSPWKTFRHSLHTFPSESPLPLDQPSIAPRARHNPKRVSLTTSYQLNRARIERPKPRENRKTGYAYHRDSHSSSTPRSISPNPFRFRFSLQVRVTGKGRWVACYS